MDERASRQEGVTRRQVARRIAGMMAAGGVLAGAACSQQQGTEPALARDTGANLVWLIWSSNTNVRGEAYNNITTAFQQEFPNVTAEQISGGGDLKSTLEKLLTLVSADQPLDIVGVQHSVLGQYVNLGILKDLTANSRRDPAFKFSDHVQSAVDMLSFKGKSYALPIGMSTSAIAYNADLFQKAGVQVPDGSWGWQQYLESAQKLTAWAETDSQWGTHILPSSSEIFYWIWMNGGEPFSPKEEPAKSSFVQPETMAAVQWFMDLNTRYRVKAPFDHPDGKGSNGKFEAGRVAFFPVQTNNTRELQDETFSWEVAPFPKGARGTVYPLSSFAYGIYDKTRHPDLAWKFWTHVVGPAGQREWLLRTGEFIPSHKSLQAEYEKVPLKPANRKVFYQAAVNGRPTPKATRWADIAPVIDAQLQAMDGAKIGVRAGLETLDRDLAPLLGAG
ncbi:MAG TPA: extracellular solute-binding protein [Chloroflexota bacterium]|nr:extracellular solute-binding protein [Chloroflexota bacterium]